MKKKEMLEKIKKGEIKMKPRWWFVAIQDGLMAAVVATLLVTGVVAAVGLFLIELKAFPENLFTLGIGGIMVYVVGKIYREIGDNYKKSIRQTIVRLGIVLAVIVVIITIIRVKYELEILLRFI